MKRCLLLCPIGIGNYLLAYPAFHLLKQSFHEVELHLVVLRESILEYAVGDPLYHSVTVIDPSKNKGPLKGISAVRRIRDLNCDTAISFFPSNRFEYNLFLFASGAKTRIAFNYPLKKMGASAFLANKKVPVEEGRHDVEQNLNALSLFNIKERTPLVFPVLFDDMDGQAAEKWTREKGVSDKSFIGIHAGSSGEHGMLAKRWSENSFIGLAKMLVERYEHHILVFGGPEEGIIKRTIVASLGDHAHSVEGLSLRQTSALISKCRMFVSNDSGLMHIAALSGVPTAGIFGPTDDTRTAPWGEKHLVIRKENDCAPCWTIANVGVRQRCPHNHHMCLDDLNPREVFEKIVEWQKS